MNETPTPAPEKPKAPSIGRNTIARVIASLACERFGHIYGSRLTPDVESGLVSWIMEAPEALQVDDEALKADAANLARFKAAAPAEWTRRKVWLNRPAKGPKLLKVLIGITRDARRWREALPAAAPAAPEPMPPAQVAAPEGSPNA